ncbi:SDR family NAD(P)-dependent oxidoreductase [Aspergillus neoniger CBS 115656]|uniref:Short chain dehydrogenase n=1 Tax=Aspergillus neoniger (strain CBS 115656) TaxID=1448310 RepID=A0A318Z0R2_ASPNB|nr:short chain dehydrogenase [Aspergillus neoniger CBS 115656]PYH37510.1 short chain dehydrogenase [Aspergillus neoniger CBS 115656]
MSFAGKLVAVTGAASGIGLAAARLLAQRESENSPKSHILTTALDVRDSAQVDSWIKKSTDKLGPLYGAANVAGVTEKQLSGDPLDAAEWDHIIGTNLTGVMHCVQAQARKASSEGASIVNVSSITVSKHGVVGLTRKIVQHLAPKNIRVNCVAPAVVSTTLTEKAFKEHQIPENLMSDMQWLAKPEEVARGIAFLLSQEAPFMTGSTYPVDGSYLY